MMDGAAMDDGDGEEQWRLWCSGGVSRGEARQREQRWCSGGCGVAAGSWRQRDCWIVAAVRPRAARWTK
jgi:hypothetical protein